MLSLKSKKELKAEPKPDPAAEKANDYRPQTRLRSMWLSATAAAGEHMAAHDSTAGDHLKCSLVQPRQNKSFTI